MVGDVLHHAGSSVHGSSGGHRSALRGDAVLIHSLLVTQQSLLCIRLRVQEYPEQQQHDTDAHSRIGGSAAQHHAAHGLVESAHQLGVALLEMEVVGLDTTLCSNFLHRLCLAGIQGAGGHIAYLSFLFVVLLRESISQQHQAHHHTGSDEGHIVPQSGGKHASLVAEGGFHILGAIGLQQRVGKQRQPQHGEERRKPHAVAPLAAAAHQLHEQHRYHPQVALE